MLLRTTDHASVLQRVGPDVDPNLTPEVVRNRYCRRAFVTASLLDYCRSGVSAGLGNYLRVEILWRLVDRKSKAKISCGAMDAHCTRYWIFRDFLAYAGTGG